MLLYKWYPESLTLLTNEGEGRVEYVVHSPLYKIRMKLNLQISLFLLLDISFIIFIQWVHLTDGAQLCRAVPRLSSFIFFLSLSFF